MSCLLLVLSQQGVGSWVCPSVASTQVLIALTSNALAIFQYLKVKLHYVHLGLFLNYEERIWRNSLTLID